MHLRCQEGLVLMMKGLGENTRFYLKWTLDYALVDFRELPEEHWPAIATCVSEALLWHCYAGEKVEAEDLQIFIENALDLGLQSPERLFWVYQVFVSLIAVLLKFHQYAAAGKLILSTYFGRTESGVVKIECGTLSMWPNKDREEIVESFKAILPDRLTMQDLKEADTHIAFVSDHKKDMWITWLTKDNDYRLINSVMQDGEGIAALGFDPRSIKRRA